MNRKRAVGDAGCGKDDLLAGRQILCAIDPLEVLDSHSAAAFLVLRLAHDETREDLAVQAAHGRGAKYSFWCPARSHHRVDPRADDSTSFIRV